MKILWRMSKEAKKYRLLLICAIASTLALTVVNLIAPRILSDMISLVSIGLTREALSTIFKYTMILLMLYLSKILFRFMSNYLSHKAAWKLVEELRVKVYDKLQSFSIGYYNDKQTGELMSRVTADTETVEQIYAHLLPETVTNAVTLVGVTGILLAINWRLALLTCIPIPFILISGWVFSHKVRPNFRIMQKARGEMSAQLQDNLSGIQEIQAFGQQGRASAQVHAKANKFTVGMLHALKISAVFHPSVEFLTALGTVIVVGFGGYFAFVGTVGLSEIVSFLLYLTLFYTPITNIAQLLESVQQALAGTERVIEILDTPVGISDSENAKPLGDVKGNLKFENVSFSYINDIPVLIDVSFEAEPGQMVAIVGSTGVGKTTLTQLIARFYDPTEGHILLDGVDIRDITLKSLHQNISMVLQDTFLFNGTIAENIAFAKPGAYLDEIERAARIANIHDDIMEMPERYETVVGERGTRLSGGQKQRISIARAVLCDAPVMILDEATASVDVHTEEKIQKALSTLSGSRTVFAIAHRLSTVKKADLILVFEGGRIVQRGTHDDLLSQDGVYRRMCSLQEDDTKLKIV